MKISKVDHKRTAVSVNEKCIKGILYDNPAQGKDPVVDIGDHYDTLIDRAEGAYSILNKEKGKEKSEVSAFRKSINKLSKRLLKKNDCSDLGETISEQMKLLRSRAMAAYIPTEGVLYDDQVERLVDAYIKRSLRVNVSVEGQLYYLPAVLSGYLKKLKNLPNDADREAFSNIVDAIGAEKIKAVLIVLNKDFRKPRRKANTVTSIEQQVVPVKVMQAEGKYILTPSNVDHPKKKYVFSFMREYVGSSEGKKKELLIHMRTMLVRYLLGQGTSREIAVNEKSFCNELSMEESIAPELDGSFDKIYKLGLEIQDLSDELQILGRKRFLNDEERQKRGKLKARKAVAEAEIKKENAFVSSKVDEALVLHFRSAIIGQDITDADRFWIDYFDGEARKILIKGHRLDAYKLSTLWLGKKIWGNWTAYIADRFIAYGKAVYHFVLPDLMQQDMSDVRFGEVQPEYRNGISSFEYEWVKAKENLDRSTTVAITSAVNTFSRAVLESVPVSYDERTKQMREENDILFAKREIYGPVLYEDAGKRLLRYFGGFSTWADVEDVRFYAEEEKGIELVDAVKRQLSDLRNSSFHYTGTEGTTDTTVVRELFDHEEKQFSDIVRQKYYSNNVYRYYKQSDTAALLDILYKEPAYSPSQVPKFRRLFNRESAYIHDKMLMGRGRQRIAGKGPEEVEIYKGTFLFLLEEIYYYAFLQDRTCKDRFIKLVFNGDEHIKVENPEALEDFQDRIKSLGDEVSLGEICQQIMTDYDLQNQNKEVHKTGKHDREKYKHFRSLLYLYMREAFVDYLLHSEKADQFRFIRNPSVDEALKSIDKQDYLKAWSCSTYNGIMKNESVLKWYVMAHFLVPKQLNHLTGALKSYEVYIKDIERRASDTKNRKRGDEVIAESARIREIVEILTFAMNFCAKTTNNIDDYFADEEDYAATLSGLVDFRNKYVSELSTALKIFSDNKMQVEETAPNGRKTRKEVSLGIYHDGTNPIPNRNIFLASMYGDLKLLSAVSDKVKESDIKEYFRKRADLGEVFKRGKCVSREEQERLREFQNKKNFIEMNDLLSYTNMVNDLSSQLVNWSYFRERDLMYMQLGVHYTKLFFTDAVSPDDIRRSISGEGFHIKDGAILYQIVAMYTYGLPLYGFDKKGKAKISIKAGVQSGVCIGSFVKNYCRESFPAAPTYNEGLFFFESLGNHRDIILTRNYIDHFKYYAGQTRSILDLYSEIYERFFLYSVNFKKSVSFILPNILEQYFVILRTEIKKEMRNGHPVAALHVTGVSSANLTYKIKKDSGETEEIPVPAHSEKYLATVKRLLEYKEQ